MICSVQQLIRILLRCHFLTCSITSVTVVFPLTQMFVFLSCYVMFNILLSIFVDAAASLFYAWLVSVHVSTPYLIAGRWNYAWVVDLSLQATGTCLKRQACSSVTLEDVMLLGECCPSGRNSSLDLPVLVFVSDAVSLSQVDVDFNALDLVNWFISVIFQKYLCISFFLYCYILLSNLCIII